MTTREDRDVLISRIVDQEATVEDWTHLRDLAQDDPEVWRDLAEAQLEQAGLAEAIRPVLDAAENVDVPNHEVASVRLTHRVRTALAWTGWAAAAAVLLAAIGLGGVELPSSTEPASRASVMPTDLGLDSAEQALDRYLDLGRRENRVLGEIPERVVLHTAPVENGEGVEVIFLRQIVERRIVSDLYRSSTDEAGRSVPVPVEVKPNVSLISQSSGGGPM